MSDISRNIYVSAGGFASPFFNFYTDASGTQELTPTNTLYLDTSYIFHRLDEGTTHPFYISDVGYEQPYTSSISLTGDGSYNDGITGSETFTLEFTGLDTSDNLYYYCTAHSTMINLFTLVATTPEVDSTAPTLVSISPLLNASNVTTDSSLVFVFSENVVYAAGNITIFDGSNNIVEVIEVSNPNVSIVNNTVTVEPTSNFSYNTTYYVNIGSGVFEDESSNAFTGLNSTIPNTGMRFTTELDITPPTLISVFPALNATDISINTNLVFTFSENVVNTTGNIYLYDASTNDLLNTFDVTGPNVSISGSQVTLNPTIDLSFNRSLYVNIDSGAFEDAAGNIYTGLDSSSGDVGMRFTTELDVTIPTIVSVSPVLNASGIFINRNLIFTFNENILRGSGFITIRRVSDDSIVQKINAVSSEVTITNNVIVLNPTDNLPYNTSLYVNIDAGFVKDLRDNLFSGLDSSSSDIGMRFSTERDLIAPRLISFTPVKDTTNVSLDSNLVFTFSEDILANSGNITIYRTSNNIILQIIDVTSSNVTISGRNVVVNPSRDLPSDLSVYVNIDSGAFQDGGNNHFVGLDSSISSGLRMRFKTRQTSVPRSNIPPTLISISPALNETNVRLDTPLVFNFSESVINVSGNIHIYNVNTNELLQTIDVNSSRVKIDRKKVTVFPPVYLPENLPVYVNISSNAFLDVDGNNYAGLDSSTAGSGMRFTTVNLTQTRLYDIIKFCQDKKCQQNIQYNRLKTGGNDPSMSAAMRYAQYVRGAKPRPTQSM